MLRINIIALHNNYFVIAQLVSELQVKVANAKWIESFSQNKDELIIIIELANRDAFYIQAHLTSSFSILNFPNKFARANKNSVSLFTELNGLKIQKVESAMFERVLMIWLQNDYLILFKLYGNRANIAVCQQNEVKYLFKKNMSLDWQLNPAELNKNPDLGFENFKVNQCQIAKVLPMIGKEADGYLEKIQYHQKTDEDKYATFLNILSYLNRPKYYVVLEDNKQCLTLFRTDTVIESPQTAIEALCATYNAHFKFNLLQMQKQKLIAQLENLATQLNKQIILLGQKLDLLSKERPLNEIADIIMANIYAIKPSDKKLNLFDFYRNQDLEIILPHNQTPNKYAGMLYKKSKNKHLEKEHLASLIAAKKQQLGNINLELNSVATLEKYKELSPYLAKYSKKITVKNSNEDASTLFHEFENMGFKIYVGKNAKNNDKLTQEFAHKNDLWLHAKDVSGSHVIIRNQSGKPFPRPVISFAASLAAFYSKRKNDSLCPVIYTPKKYVRKVKGAADGAVRVDKEQVLMVVPYKA